jgi:hypothetical protein
MSLAIPKYVPWSSSRWISILYFECGNERRNPIDESQRYGNALHDLIDGTYSHASDYAYLMDYRNYDYGALEARKTSSGLPKPKVRLLTTVTSHRNLSVKWYPGEYPGISGNRVSDWRAFNDIAYPGNRPPNELMFVREVRYLQNSIPIQKPDDDEAIRHYVSYILIAAFNELKEHVAASFEMELVNDIEIGQDEQGYMQWYLFDVDERNKGDAQKWLDDFPTTFGIPLTTVRMAIDDPANRNAAGTVRFWKVWKQLKQDAPALTQGRVEKMIKRLLEIEQRWPLLLPALRPYWTE